MTLRERDAQLLAQEAIRRMAAGIAHTLNDLVTAIGANADLLAEPAPTADDHREIAKSVRAAVDRVAVFLERLETLARPSLVVAGPVDLTASLRAAEPNWRTLLGASHQLQLELPGNPVLVNGDETELIDAVGELLTNSRDAMPFGGVIRLTVEEGKSAPPPRTRKGVAIVVTDTGVGIPLSDLDKVFEPFSAAERGGGLGLPVVASIARQHGGVARIAHTGPGGTVAELWLPAAEEVSAAAAYVTGEHSGAGETILVLDDDDGVRAVTARVLKRAGYHVRAVTGGEEALEFAASHRGEIHLLVTDVAMPDIDGYEVARRLQKLRPGLKVLTMSGFPAAAIEARQRGEDFGPLLRKPFTFQALLDAVRAALDPTAGGAR
ncbi:MAG: response regulator [Gemmatimonadaceae bacterium]|nr:response regulator [Gemmatimonadaceae bacterium]